jgi:hypothetical protein
VLAAGLSASDEEPCAVLHTGQLHVSNVKPPDTATRNKALQWLLVSSRFCGPVHVVISVVNEVPHGATGYGHAYSFAMHATLAAFYAFCRMSAHKCKVASAEMRRSSLSA